MQKFKVGDKVICVDAEDSNDVLRECEIYTVCEYSHTCVELVGKKGMWCVGRFELHSAAENNKGITVESAIAFLISQGYTVTLSKA